LGLALDPVCPGLSTLSSPHSRHAHFLGYAQGSPRKKGHKGFLGLLKIGLLDVLLYSKVLQNYN
jgi:hypothetical protein